MTQVLSPDIVYLPGQIQPTFRRVTQRRHHLFQRFVHMQDAFVFRLIDRVTIRGKTEASNIYELMCAKAELNEDLRRMLAIHNRAMATYLSGDVAQSKVLFAELKGMYPEQRIYTTLLDRLKPTT